MEANNEGALCDLTLAIEFLSTAARALAMGHALDSKKVAEPLEWAVRKITPLDKKSPYGAELRRSEK